MIAIMCGCKKLYAYAWKGNTYRKSGLQHTFQFSQDKSESKLCY